MSIVGIIRNIDQVGRVVIPKEIRKNFNIRDGDPVEITASENQIIIKKYEAGCKFCGNRNNLIEHNDYFICNKCILQIYKKRKEDSYLL